MNHASPRRAFAAALAGTLLVAASTAFAATGPVPLPRAKPAGTSAGPAAARLPGPAPERARERAPEARRETTAPPAAAETDAAFQGCLAALRGARVRFEPLAPIAENACGAPRPLSVTAIGGIAVQPAATMRCPTALALARWTSEVVEPAATLHLGATVSALDVAASYVCRMRRTESGGSVRLSEHALANAVDVPRVRLAEGAVVPVMPRPGSAAPERAFQAAIRGGACALFATVIGPTTNALHDDHLHLDLAQRRGGAKLCQ